MFYYFSIIFFLFGLVVGSFINCVVYRLSVKKSFLHGRSFCPGCKKQIHWYDNIPLFSFAFLRAKCRHCRGKISWQYPLVEFIAGILFVVVFLATVFSSYPDIILLSHGSIILLPFIIWLKIIINLIFTGILITIFLYDLKYYLILDKITLPAIAFAFIANLAICYTEIPDAGKLLSCFLYLLLSAAVAAGFFFLQFVVSRGKWIGGGDIRLGALMGAMLGWPGVLLALFLSYIIGSIVGVGLLVSKRATPKSQVPFGTFLSLGTILTLLWGGRILDWYLGLIF